MQNNEKDLLVMKFLHYFITEKNYNPVVVHGIQNEIWLENMDSEYRIIRLVLGYIHNDEQLNFDDFKVKRMTNQIRLKTFTLKMKVLTLYLDINADLELNSSKNNIKVSATSEEECLNNGIIKKSFTDMKKKLKFDEEGLKLYEKINTDILKKNIDKTEKINEIFKTKKPVVTFGLISVMTFIFIMMYLIGNGSLDTYTLYNFGALVKNKEYFRVLTSIFLHIGVLHLLMNMYSLYILGKQVESFYGHIKTFIIFILSGICGNLLSIILMNSNTISAGASGAIFGLMGALLYFAYNQRTYMADALKREILPVLIINLLFTFSIPSINMFAHIGGLIGGIIISNAVGIKYKTSSFEKKNGILASIILFGLLIYFAYFK